MENELSIAELEDKIAKKKEYMHYEEMGDDFYYTNGKRDADLRELSQLQRQLRELKEAKQ